jgi:hypothetical protein
MKLPRREFLHLAAGAVALPAASRIARAQTYPARLVRLVVGFAAGGGTDIAGRLTGQWLSARLGQPFIIENRPLGSDLGGAGRQFGRSAVGGARVRSRITADRWAGRRRDRAWGHGVRARIE